MAKILSIIIPVYNEEKTIEKILEATEKTQLPNFKKEILIVDDGSTDGTREILKKLAAKYQVLFHKRNRGKGAAIKTALHFVKGDYVIIQDADLEYDPADWQKLIETAEQSPKAVIYGSRNLGTAGRGYLPYYLGGRLLTSLVNLLFRTRLTDINTGYKLFPTEILRTLNLQSNGFEFCEEVTCKILKRGNVIKEVPIGYRPRTFQEGKKISFWDGLIGIWTIIKNRF